MRPMKIAVLACVGVAAILLSGQIVWAQAEQTPVEWRLCAPNKQLEFGEIWYSGENDKVFHVRDRLFRNAVCWTEECTCESIKDAEHPNGTRPPDGYQFQRFGADWKKPPVDAEHPYTFTTLGTSWGEFWITLPNPDPSLPPDPEATPLWQGTFQAHGDGVSIMTWNLVGFGVGDFAGMKLKASCEWDQPTPSTPPNQSPKNCSGYILSLSPPSWP